MAIVLTLLVILVVLCFAGAIFGAIASRPPKPSAPKQIMPREERKELKTLKNTNREYEQLVHRIDKIVYDNRQLDPALATMVIDEIAHFKANRD